MRKFNIPSVILFLLIIISACSKTDPPPVIPNPPVVVPPVVVPPVTPGEPADPYIKLQGLAATSGLNFLRDSVWSDKVSHTIVLSFSGGNTLAVLPSFEKNIYPGAIVKGRYLGSKIEPEKISDYLLNPITVLTSIVTDETDGTIKTPSYNANLDYLQKVLTAKSNFTQINSFLYDSYEFTHTNELNLFFGGNVDINTLFGIPKSNGAAVTKIKSGIVVRSIQLNFTVYMDPSLPIEFKQAVDQNLFKSEKISFVNSVDYGRMGLLTIQTDAEKNELNVIINKVSKSEALDERQTKLIATAEIHTYLNGYSAAGKQSVEVASGLDKIQKFYKLISGEGTFSASNYGSPLYYSLQNAVSDYADYPERGHLFRVHVERDKITSTK
ncbi:hypothetical protein HDF26_000874 [Pedobacter cryoconitis]|uniref:thiol-activated cytolysin family protein n=1 Tax=Pedobacter cryoconitis TaxID=188932 RepID=UPI0016148F81|nr:thiol-activated cytolysin family protein [Pedobacter cryoconitis]MBB6270447.1 hypothetical protein [Pedobacter cryoconitis]